MFSIRGTENLGNKLVLWRKEWEQCNQAMYMQLVIPNGKPSFWGYVTQQHNLRSNKEGMTQGWQIFGKKLDSAIKENIIDKLKPIDQTVSYDNGNYNLGKIPNLHSLIPYSLNARKPVFDCNGSDGLRGAHITTARESVSYFDYIVDRIINVI